MERAFKNILYLTYVSLAVFVSINGSADTQVAGENYTLTCLVTGGEAMTHEYRWFGSDLQIPGDTSNTLSFSPLGEADSGGYTCEVTTGSLATNASVTITVEGKCMLTLNNVSVEVLTLTDPDHPLVVTLNGSGGAQLAGVDYTLTCQFAGGEAVTPVYRWFKGGNTQLTTNKAPDTLSFSPLRETDSGGYTCEVTTGSMTSTSASVAITVEGKCKSCLCMYTCSGGAPQ